MNTPPSEGRHLGRSVDHLGFLSKQLRDLTGFASLTYELVQNADDAEGSTWMAFAFTKDALVVDNDGVFSDCGDPSASDCPWPGHMCDFHRFRRVASGDKREQQGTTGAFGVGFTAVYQITDNPELISGGRHWILNEIAPEESRILECGGCESCRNQGMPGTRIILPWAFDEESQLRSSLRCEAISLADVTRLEVELLETIPTAMLFLRRLTTIDIRSDQAPVKRFDRLIDGDDLLISEGGKDSTWHMIRGEFGAAETALRERHGHNIEPKRSSQVTVAIPREAAVEGVLCATFPTRQDTGFPFHVNADFYPSSDRKKIIFESDFQSEWNRAALEGAAKALAQELSTAPSWLPAPRIWSMLLSLYQVKQEMASGHKETALGFFWDAAVECIPEAPLALTADNRWLSPQDVVVLRDEDEREAVTVLQGLGINVIHEDLRPFALQLPRTTLGIDQLDIAGLIAALRSAGLTKRTELDALPTPLRSHEGLGLLWRQLDRLLDRASTQQRPQAELRLATCAISLGVDGWVCPPSALFAVDDETLDLFTNVVQDIPFADAAKLPSSILRLSPEFLAESAVTAIEHQVAQTEPGRTIQLPPSAGLLSWFEKRRGEVLESDDLVKRLAALPIYPSGGQRRRPLFELFLPGDFTDPLQLADIVDLAALDGCKEFLKDLRAEELTFLTYARSFLPAACNQQRLTDAQVRRVVELLASHVGELLDDAVAHEALATLLLVECSNGRFYSALRAYFEQEELIGLMGDEVPFARLPNRSPASMRELLTWLGVASEPRPDDLVRRINRLTLGPPEPSSRAAIQRIVSYYGKRSDDDTMVAQVAGRLAALAWLPARGRPDEWFEPISLYLAFREYLFATQALFLDLPANVQAASANFLRRLGLNEEPDADQVVDHLLECSRSESSMNREVYTFLAPHRSHPSVQRLADKECILLSSGQWVHPSRVFWDDPGLGRFRRALDREFRDYYDLLTELGVRDSAQHTDAWDVLQEISAEFGPGNQQLDDEAQAVLLRCWQKLSDALQVGDLGSDELEKLRGRKVIANSEALLYRPDWIFFEDRAGLAEKFRKYAGHNIIRRPEGAWPAMEAAGARWLSDVVESHLVECSQPIDDPELSDRIRSRIPQLLRVFEAHQEQELDSDRFDEIRMVGASDLVAQFTMVAFDRSFPSDPEPAESLYRREEDTLYFVRRSGRYPWPGIARELTLALLPNQEPGPLASPIKDVLSAETPNEADAILDELGYRPLEVDGEQDRISAAPVALIGGETGTELPQIATLTDGAAPSGGIQGLAVDEAIRSILGDGVQPPAPPPSDLGSGDAVLPGTLGPGGRSPSGGEGSRSTGHQPSQRGKLRSYVYSKETPGSRSQQPPDAAEKRDALAQAGVDHAMRYEEAAGRVPEEMPPYNPGFDIKSKDRAGNVLRFIEVKSSASRWDGQGVGLTRREFDESNANAERSWLYVVERAEADDYRIHRIQDPARLVNQFMYDAGWAALAEPDANPTATASRDEAAEEA